MSNSGGFLSDCALAGDTMPGNSSALLLPAITTIMKHQRSLQILAALFVAGLVLSFTFIATAQSGRRGAKSSSAPPVVPTAEPPASKPSPQKLAPLAVLLVGLDKSDGFSPIPLGVTSGVLDNCVDRLNDSASVKVIREGDSLGRGDAIKKAKSGTEGQHVVWLRVALDRFDSSRGANTNINDVFIEYMVFAPTTAKVVTSGRTYPQAYRNRSVIPTARTGGLYGDYRYNEAARDAAERILSALHIPTRTLPHP